ncbi:hypothetical protein JWR97_16910, partial [Pseudomonas cedrina subsp. fulgida]|nr:hypothetical protein [Pseudomonas cedrina subsp. fulgida]
DRSHAPRGNAAWDAPRSFTRAWVTRSVTGCITTQSVGTISVQLPALTPYPILPILAPVTTHS